MNAFYQSSKVKKKVIIFSLILLAVGILFHVYLSYRPYNIILITIDTQRPDYLSSYNPEAEPTPNIDHIANEGVLFTRAFSLIPITMPAHTSMFTSQHPHELKVFNNGDRYSHKYPMFTDLLERRGYTTGAFVSLGVLSATFGLAQGFDKYDDDFDNTNGRSYRWASEVNEAVLPWIEKNKDGKFFAWIHYSDPHEPYIPFDAPDDLEVLVNGKSFGRYCLAKKEKITLNFAAQPGQNVIELRPLPEGKNNQSKRFLDENLFVTPDSGKSIEFGQGFAGLKLRTRNEVQVFEDNATILLQNENPKAETVQVRFSGGVWENRASEIRKHYTAETQFVDRHIGELWKKLSEWKLLHKTIVIVTSDHGEGLKTHGILGHVDKLWNETTHIPFIVYYPWIGKTGKKVDVLVNQLDIMPTILDLAHVRHKKSMKGYSLKRYVSRSPIDLVFGSSINRQWTFASTFRPEATHNAFSVTNGDIKVIHTPTKNHGKWEAYDLIQDPIEKKNLVRVDPKRFRSLSTLRALLEAHRREAEAAHANREAPTLSEEEEEMLRTLGYVAGDEENGNQ
jgi:arylsulfatase A-like enzyme